MTTLLDHLDSRPSSTTVATTTTPAQRLRATMAAARVSFTWMGTQKTLTREQKAQAAEAFDAEGQFLSAGKKLIDTRHTAFRAVTAIRGKVDVYWKGLSLPFPEPGVRLIKHDMVESFAAQMADFRTELDDAVANLDRHYGELKQAARERLGSLFNPADYPETLVGLFGVVWDFPNVEPPDYLVQLSPGLYEAERARVSARFEEAVQLAEQAFLEEFSRLVAHLTERIGGVGEDGQPRVFRDSAVENLTSFFDRFRALNVRSNDQLDALVAEARRAVRGVGAQQLRDGEGLRREVATQLSRVQDSLDAMLVERPRRRILRQAAGPGRGLMQIVVATDGRVRAIYGEVIALDALGPLVITRASVVEPDEDGRWHADLRLLPGPMLGPFERRSEALAAEVAWLEQHWLLPRS